MAVDESPWAVPAGSGNLLAPESTEVGSAGHAGRIPRLFAAVCFAAIVLLSVILVLQPYNMTVHSGQHQYDAMSGMPDLVPFLLASLISVVLLFTPRTREFALGFGLGFSALWFSAVYAALSWPKGNADLTTLSQWCVVGSKLLALPAAVCILIAALRGRAGAPAGTAPFGLARWRTGLFLAGIVAFGSWGAAGFVDTIKAVPGANSVAQGLSARPVECCTFNGLSGAGKIDIVSAIIMGLVLVLLATGVRSAAVSSGIFAGMSLAVVGVVAINVTMLLFPIEFDLGLQNPYLVTHPVQASDVTTYSSLTGFWLGLGSFILLALLAAIRLLMYRSRQDPRPSTQE